MVCRTELWRNLPARALQSLSGKSDQKGMCLKSRALLRQGSGRLDIMTPDTSGSVSHQTLAWLPCSSWLSILGSSSPQAFGVCFPPPRGARQGRGEGRGQAPANTLVHGQGACCRS